MFEIFKYNFYPSFFVFADSLFSHTKYLVEFSLVEKYT